VKCGVNLTTFRGSLLAEEMSNWTRRWNSDSKCWQTTKLHNTESYWDIILINPFRQPQMSWIIKAQVTL